LTVQHDDPNRRSALSGVRVLDFSTAVSGPFTTRVLADLGADVIKIEPPVRGDYCRDWGPVWGGNGCYFLDANSNKRSITLDLKNPGSGEPMRRLLRSADVVVENFRPGVMSRLGLGFDDVRDLRADIIYCSISAFGQTGPRSTEAGYDPTIQALSGMMLSTGEEGRPPIRIGPSVVDKGASLWSAIAIITALYHRRTTGLGQHIDISLMDAALNWMSMDILSFLATGESPQRMGSAGLGSVPSQVFPAADGDVHIAAGNQDLWSRLCTAIDRPELINDQRFGSNAARLHNRAELIPILEGVIRNRPRQYWVSTLKQVGVPCAPVNTIRETLLDPQLVDRGTVRIREDAAWVASPLRFTDLDLQDFKSPPARGEDTTAILRDELKFDADEVALLRDQSVIE
jgi:crotonobetainyl-CoA:carnitine CoA-transferase CaiB-like acyl-CoA transferase